MSQDNEQTPQPPREVRPGPTEPLEEHGIVNEVVVPIVASGAAGATNAVVSNWLKKKDK